MDEDSRRSRGRVFRAHGIVDDHLWTSVQNALFLPPDHSLSCVEVYQADLIAPARNARRLKRVESNLEGAAMNPGKTPPEVIAVDDDECGDSEADAGNEDGCVLETGELEVLRTPEDIVDYIGKTKGLRAFFIRQSYSWGPLLITSHLFDSLMFHARISPRLKNFIMYIGGREREVEIAPPKFRFTQLSPLSDPPEPDHECIYGLRFIERNGRIDPENPSREWSLRQSTIFCRYAPKRDGISWLFITISQRMQQQLNSIFGHRGYVRDTNPLETHFVLIESAVSGWRQYLIDLSAEIDSQYSQILGTSPSDEGPIDLHQSGKRQQLLILDKRLLDSLLAVSATADTLTSLMVSFEMSTDSWQFEPPCFAKLARSSFEDQKRELRHVTSIIENLRYKLAGIASLLSSFLDLNSGFSLQNLVKESGKENEEMRRLSQRMHTLAEKSTQDAAAVKVLTILTLIYLPITVVSNFFSTSFVTTTNESNGSGSIIVSGDWWILLAVSVPLTLITIYIWLVWTRIQLHPSNQPWWWYVVGMFLTPRQRKLDVDDHNGEKRKTSPNGHLVYSEALNAERSGQISQRRPSEFC